MTTTGLDIGGTKTVALLMDQDGTVVATHRLRTPAEAGPYAVLNAAAEAVRRVHELAGAPLPRLLGVGTAGVVDRATGRIITATSAMRGWAGADVRGELSARLDGARVVVRNDVHAFALAEGWRGAAAGARDYLALTVGTGIGGAVVSGGRLIEGAHQRAGHLGHVAVPQAHGVLCPCGATGHLEAVASGPAMVQALNAAGGEVGTAEDIAAAVAAGDERAVSVVRRAGEALGNALASLVAVTDPELVVIGGGALGVGDMFLDAARSALPGYALPPLGQVPIRRSRVEEPVAVGAAFGARLVGGDNS